MGVADAARSLSCGIFGEPSRSVQVACVLRLVLKPDFRKLRHVKSQLAYSKIMCGSVCVWCMCVSVSVYVDVCTCMLIFGVLTFPHTHVRQIESS